MARADYGYTSGCEYSVEAHRLHLLHVARLRAQRVTVRDTTDKKTAWIREVVR